MFIDIAPEVLLYIIQQIPDLTDICNLQMTCKYLYEFINQHRVAIKATKLYKYTIHYMYDLYIFRCIDFNNNGTFLIERRSSNSYTLSGTIINNKIVLCKKKYISDARCIWEIYYTDEAPDSLLYNYASGNIASSMQPADIRLCEYSDFLDSYNVLINLIHGKLTINEFTSNRIFR